MSEVVIPLTLLVGGLVAMLWYAVVEDRRNSRTPPRSGDAENRVHHRV